MISSSSARLLDSARRPESSAATTPRTPGSTPGEAAARRDLRAQIAKLEASGATTPALVSGPRLLSLGELEALRDALASCSRSAAAAEAQDRARRRLEAMLTDPGAHRRERVSLAELGRPGCGVYRVEPRLGLVGMLAGWWELTLSSGCP